MRTEQLFSNRVWVGFAVWGGGRSKNCNRKITNPPSQRETSQLCPFPTTDVTKLEVSAFQTRVLPSEGTALPQHHFSPGLSSPGFLPAQMTILPSSDSLDQKSSENHVSKPPVFPASVSWYQPAPRMCDVGPKILLPSLPCDSGQVIKLGQPRTGARQGTSPEPAGRGEEGCAPAFVEKSSRTVIGGKEMRNLSLVLCTVCGQEHTPNNKKSTSTQLGLKKRHPSSEWFTWGRKPRREEAAEPACLHEGQSCSPSILCSSCHLFNPPTPPRVFFCRQLLAAAEAQTSRLTPLRRQRRHLRCTRARGR